jgi:hypothetical protein
VFNAPVTITGPESHTAPTNSDGCAFFAFLAAGTYTVQLGSTGYVDQQSNPAPSQTLGVSIGNISSVQFDYDAAAALQLTLQSDAAFAPPADLPITVENPHIVPNGLKLYPGTGTTRTITGLFPFLDGYHVWAGGCADADPEGQIVGTDGGGNPVQLGPYWPGATREAEIEVQPGGTATQSVRLRDAQLHVTQAGVPLAGRTVRVTHFADNICGSNEVHTAGVTDATGTVSVALPYGTWRVTVTGKSPVGAWPDAVLDPTGSGIVVVEVPVT